VEHYRVTNKEEACKSSKIRVKTK